MRINLPRHFAVFNPRTEKTLATFARQATAEPDRITGLLDRSELQPGEGLWIVPCAQIHTVGMRFGIDVLFLDNVGRVLCAVSDLGVSNQAACFGASSALELPAGIIRVTGTKEGDVLRFEAV